MFAGGLVAATALAAASPVALHAIVVGNDAPLPGHPELATLRYADDDAVRFWEFFRAFDPHATLLTVEDEETLHRAGFAARPDGPPTLAALKAALDRTYEAMRAEKARGLETELVFVYAGHGSYDEAHVPYFHFLDGPLRRDEFLPLVAGPQDPADRIHLVLDACLSSAMVGLRGAGSGASLESALLRESVEAYPRVGVLAATSADEALALEWQTFEAGVFSQLVLSALTGAADADDDGTVTYEELEAFLAVATETLQPDLRPRFTLVAPKVPPRGADRTPLVNLDQGRFPRLLRLEKGDGGRFYLLDDRRVRVLDFNKAVGHGMTLHLLRPGAYVAVADLEGRTAVIPPIDPARPPPQTLLYRALEFEPSPPATRGIADDRLLRELFATPFGLEAFDGYLAAKDGLDRPPAAEAPGRLGPWTVGLGAAAVVGAVAGGVLLVLAHGQVASLEAAPHDHPDEALATARRLDAWGQGLVAGGGLLGAGAAGAFVLRF